MVNKTISEEFYESIRMYLPPAWRYHYGRPKNASLTPEDLNNFMEQLIRMWKQIRGVGVSVKLDNLRHPNVARDWLNFLASVNAIVSMEGSLDTEVWFVKANLSQESKKKLYYAIQSFAVDIISAVDELMQRDKSATRVMVTLNPMLGELFNCYGFGLINPKTGKVYITLPKKDYWNTDFRRSWLYNNLRYWAKEFSVALDEYDEMKKKEEQLRNEKTVLTLEEKEKCASLNERCAYKPLLEEDWCDVPEKYVLGPLETQQCFDLMEICNHIESQLTMTKYGNPYPQVPSDPFNRTPFSAENLNLFWDKARLLNIRDKIPKMARYVAAVQMDIVPQTDSDGHWTPKDLENVMNILDAR